MMYFVIIVLIFDPGDTRTLVDIKEFDNIEQCQSYAADKAVTFYETGTMVDAGSMCEVIPQLRSI
ncbi:MAG: hypothetical protein JKY93_12320 [Gammaproteobacteria bacterium]|nr:hypothetical protein [Gammaproteobacteria bacterium]